MNTRNPTHQLSSEAGWQILGERELSVHEPAEAALHAWLTEIFNPLGLPPQVLTKIIQSVEDAVTHATRTDTARKMEHIHLVVFTPIDRARTQQTWNFFRVEKIEEANLTDRSSADHAIEFYLYGEGD